MRKKGLIADEITRHVLEHTDVQNNIESLIGTVEIPVGLVGPLLFRNEGVTEQVFCAAGTLEGALVASMNRGAKAISMSGGFSAEVHHQKMVRSPLFILHSDQAALRFENWVEENTAAIAKHAESFSNHARLLEIIPFRHNENVHLKFVYTTGDAAGQNMTTTCTWHAMLWVVENFEIHTGIKIEHYVIEGNGASDKKVSRFLNEHGRGLKVVAKCVLLEDVIHKVLRTTSDNLLRFHLPAQFITANDGMIAYNINIANAIAAIFVATGQDLASIHESSVGEFSMKKVPEGLEVKMTLPSLVVGTVGGGTNLPKQQECLKLMACNGSGKINRFAQLIAGFALSLDISTNAAIVSGEFAKAHEKLGRNKPVDWLQWNEINEQFVKKCIGDSHNGQKITAVQLKKGFVENGILTNITKRVNRKIIGFIPVELQLENGTAKKILIKSKGTDLEVIKGLHLMAASINPELSDLISKNWNHLEYADAHLKELLIYRELSENVPAHIPFFHGSFQDLKREIFLVAQEQLEPEQLLLLDSENHPEKWTGNLVRNCLNAINEIHHFFLSDSALHEKLKTRIFAVDTAEPLYRKLAEILKGDYQDMRYDQLDGFMNDLKTGQPSGTIRKTVVHNDFNPRNTAIRKNGEPCIYDWELATVNYPHRDVVEFLSFVLPSDFAEVDFLNYLEYHFKLAKADHPGCTWDEWKEKAAWSAREFLVTRVAFYKVSEILMKLKFVDRIFANCLRMIQILETK